MAWTSSNPVTIGNPTKKSDYDKLWDNAQYLKTEFEIGHVDSTGKHLILEIDGIAHATDGGTGDVRTLTLSPVPSAYYTGMTLKIKSAAANTGAVTLNVNSLGAKSIKKNYDQALVANDIKSGAIYVVVYDGTNFQLVSVASQDLAYTGLQAEHSSLGVHKILNLDGVRNATTVGGTGDAITLAFTPAVPSLYTGLHIRFKSGAVNTGAVTINCESLGAKALKKNSDQALIAGDIKSGQWVLAQYDGTNFQMLSQKGNIDISPQYTDLTPKTGDATLTATELAGNVIITNTGAGGAVELTLQAGTADYSVRGIVTVAQYLRFTAAGSDKFRYYNVEGAAGGYIRSNVIGTSFLLVWSGGNWVITDLVGFLLYDE